MRQLGSTTVIGSDKTGTLTENRMTVREIWAGGRTFTFERADELAERLAPGSPLHLTLLAGILASEAQLRATGEGQRIAGDPTEAALLVAARALGLDIAEERAARPRRAQVAFEPERCFAASVHDHDGEPILSRLLWERTILAAAVMAGGTVALFGWSLARGGSLVEAQTVALTTMVLFQTFQVGNARSERLSLLRMRPLSNPFLFVAAFGALAVHVTALYWGPTQLLLRVEPIDLAAWPLMVAVALTVVAAAEAHKALRPIRSRSSDGR